MSRPDVVDLLRRGAAHPRLDHDLGELWRQGVARRRRKRLLAGGAAALVVAAAVVAVRWPVGPAPTIGPTPDGGTGVARLHVEQVFADNTGYIEGSFSYLEVHDASTGEMVIEEVFTGDAPAVLDRELAPGSYRLVSYQRPCEASCPDLGGGLDPPTDRCESVFDAAADTTTVATITVSPGQGCAIRLEPVASADAPAPPCPSEAVAVSADTTQAASAGTSVTVSLTHTGDATCMLVTGVRLALTDGAGDLLFEIEGNPYTWQLDQPLNPGETTTVTAVWTSWCEGSSANLDVTATAHGAVSREVPAPACRTSQHPQLLPVDPAPNHQPAAQPDQVRVDHDVEGAPPFYLDLGQVEVEPAGGAWAAHRVSIISEWRTPIAVSLADATVHLPGRPGEAETRSDPGVTRMLQPREETTITVAVQAGSDPPPPGTYRATLQIPFWRDVGTQAPTGPADGTATIGLTYELLSEEQATAAQRFCAQAPDIVRDATATWRASQTRNVQPLLAALQDIATLSEQLTGPDRKNLDQEIAALRATLEQIRDTQQNDQRPQQGFDTIGLVSIINHLCKTDLTSTGMQP